jgi:hypothetical protein
MQITTIGLDIAKNVFQVHGIDAAEKVVVRKQLRRGQVMKFFEALPPCLVGMEACATAHYWARELTRLGHQVRLMPGHHSSLDFPASSLPGSCGLRHRLPCPISRLASGASGQSQRACAHGARRRAIIGMTTVVDAGRVGGTVSAMVTTPPFPGELLCTSGRSQRALQHAIISSAGPSLGRPGRRFRRLREARRAWGPRGIRGPAHGLRAPVP